MIAYACPKDQQKVYSIIRDALVANERRAAITKLFTCGYDYSPLCEGCEVILCAPGYKCVGNPVSGSAYCDPSCDRHHSTFHCGDEQTCILIDGDCPLDESGPCPHHVRCIDSEYSIKRRLLV